MPQERSAGLVIFRMDGGEPSFLLLHYGWGHWGFPKGNIEPGEAEKEAAIRETEEETGLSSFRFVDDFMEKIEYFYRKEGKTIHKEVVYFLAETEERDVKVSYEHRGCEWLKFDEALSQLSFDNDKEILRKANEAIAKLDHFPSRLFRQL